MVRVAMLLEWLAPSGGPATQLTTWGELQFLITQGLQLPGFTPAQARLALGQV